MVLRENKNNACAGFGGANGECCGIFRTGLLTLPVQLCPHSTICPVGNHSLISRLVVSRPTQSRYSIVWDVNVTLDNYFRQWKDNNELSLKELSLKTTALVALVTAQRVQSLHKLDLDSTTQENGRITFKFDLLKQIRPSVKSPIIELCAYLENPKICVVKTLSHNLERTVTVI